MIIPVIENTRLVLHEGRKSDFEAYAAFRGQVEEPRHIGVLDRGKAWRAMAYLTRHWALLGYGLWSVTRKSGEPVGDAGPDFPQERAEPEMGWKTAISLIADDNAPSNALALRRQATLEGPDCHRTADCTIYRHRSPQVFQSKFKGDMTWH